MKMEKPTVEAVRFGSRDVIATSGQLGVMLGGFDNGRSGDWFVSNEKGATSGTRVIKDIADYFKAASGVVDDPNNFLFESEGYYDPFQGLMEDEELSGYAIYNGWYIWYTENGRFVKQP